MENIEDWDKRLAFETQVQEFGQVPQQLFDKPHSRKLSKQDLLLSRQSSTINPLHLVEDTIKSTSSSRSNTLSDSPQIFSNTLDNTINVENDVNWDMSTIVNDQCNSGEEEEEIGHVESECQIVLFQLQMMVFYEHIRTKQINQIIFLIFVINVENELKEINSIAFIGSYDQSIYIYNLTNSLLPYTQKLHEDVIVDVYVSSKINSFPSCTCLDVLEEHDLLAVGCHDSTILLCDLTTGQILIQWNSSSEDHSKIMSIQFHNDGLFLAYLCTTKLALIDIMTGTEVFKHSSSSIKFRSLFYSNNILIIGCKNDSIKLFSMKSSSFLPLSLHICDTAITTIAKHTHNMASGIYDKIYFFGTEDGSIHMYSMRYDNKTHV
ncbi:unnamed protein product [Didymodactylos carnosus]|uniref:BEACH domain-containing protein n=1 Tax=Didymodactylos carnosus TaxID=1234261 RepID=A0A815DLH2_9BILA|nr:unnamed protein product [Didymodactylos carnosus]CAF4118128.1 unnamed protein product [Didymodactylos carnosus]